MTTFDEFKRNWQGRRIDYDHTHAYQCVDLPQQYSYEVLGVQGLLHGNAINYWTNTPSALSAVTDRISNSNAQKGDIVILKTIGQADYSGEGHIGIATGNLDANNIEILEQNGYGGGDGLAFPDGRHRNEIGTRSTVRSRVAGLLRPKIVVTLPPYTTENIPQKIVVINKYTHRYGINHGSFGEIAADNLGDAKPGDRFVTGLIAHHQCGQDYYIQTDNGFSVPNGFNVRDCVDYIAPAPPPPPPSAPPAAPLPFKPAETYTVDWELPLYDSAEAAKWKRGAEGILRTGSYYIWGSNDTARLLGTSNMHKPNPETWINVDHNVPPEIPAPVVTPEPLPSKITETIEKAGNIADQLAGDVKPVPKKLLYYDWIRGDRQPVRLRSTNTSVQTYKDLENPDTAPRAQLKANHELDFSMMTIKDGAEYYIPTLSLKQGYRHGIPKSILEPIPPEPIRRMDRNRDGDVDMGDYIDYIGSFLRPGVDVVARTVKSVKTRKFIDGFSKGIKKDKVQ